MASHFALMYGPTIGQSLYVLLCRALIWQIRTTLGASVNWSVESSSCPPLTRQSMLKNNLPLQCIQLGEQSKTDCWVFLLVFHLAYDPWITEGNQTTAVNSFRILEWGIDNIPHLEWVLLAIAILEEAKGPAAGPVQSVCKAMDLSKFKRIRGLEV